MTKIKLGLMNLILVIGAILIAVVQWPTAVKAVGESQGIMSAVLLECLIAGIPIIVWGLVAHFALSWLFLRQGELDTYKARREIQSLPPQDGETLPSIKRDMLD